MLGGLSTGAGGRLGLPDDTLAGGQQQATAPVVINDGAENESGEILDNQDARDPA
jgi:hypothetical protein